MFLEESKNGNCSPLEDFFVIISVCLLTVNIESYTNIFLFIIEPFTNNIFQLKEQLRSGLNALPAPKNDYEIVVPDSEGEMEAPVEAGNSVEDQADVDTRYLAELKAKRV